MDVDVHFYCTVPMDDAGAGAPAATDRRYGQADYLACYENLEHWAKTADSLGFSTMWLTEHHFQYEGYEVVPNLIQFGQHLASSSDKRSMSFRSGIHSASPRTLPWPTSSLEVGWCSASAEAPSLASPRPSEVSLRQVTTRWQRIKTA
jgi:alkanesulfonate monooxygenase SsuD/methylene tetrahydromethanopterin reductase-like flavin-dependent oxidoreductase (luciferase family)